MLSLLQLLNHGPAVELPQPPLPGPLQAPPAADQHGLPAQAAPAQPAALVQPVQLQLPTHSCWLMLLSLPECSPGTASEFFKAAQLAANIAPFIIHQADLPLIGPG